MIGKILVRRFKDPEIGGVFGRDPTVFTEQNAVLVFHKELSGSQRLSADLCLIGVYERTDVSLLKDVFLYAYERSAARYAEVRQTLGDPDPFRLRYRDAVRQVVAEVITQALPPEAAKEHLTSYARQLSKADRETFINAVETELPALHEGNFARYRVTPSQFARWEKAWKADTGQPLVIIKCLTFANYGKEIGQNPKGTFSQEKAKAKAVCQAG